MPLLNEAPTHRLSPAAFRTSVQTSTGSSDQGAGGGAGPTSAIAGRSRRETGQRGGGEREEGGALWKGEGGDRECRKI